MTLSEIGAGAFTILTRAVPIATVSARRREPRHLGERERNHGRPSRRTDGKVGSANFSVAGPSDQRGIVLAVALALHTRRDERRGTMADEEFSDEVLEETPARATKLLTGMARNSVVRTLMAQGGMKDSDASEGRSLLMACLGASEVSPQTDTDDARARREAVAELDAWDEPNFARYQAALRRHHRAAGEHVFRGLTAATGAAAVQSVATFLTRVDQVTSGAVEGISAADGKKIAAFLSGRGLNDGERKRLAKLVHLALGPGEMLPEADPSSTEARRAKLVALREWYNDWVSVARAEVKRRDHLLLLGLAQRKAKKKTQPA